MVNYIRVPKDYIQGDYILDTSEIVGKCAGYSSIPIGSPFYRIFIVDCDTVY